MVAEKYYGEGSCVAVKKNGVPCTNKAYYQGGLCGVHSSEKIPLSKNPLAKEMKQLSLSDHMETVMTARMLNKESGLPGNVIVTKMRMMKSPPDVEGYLKIFPNRRHGDRKDGEGYSELSPMCLGPVNHGEPGFPPALNIENYYQFSKVFPSEVDVDGKVKQEFFDLRRKVFLEPVAERHKIKGVKPLFSLFLNEGSQEERYTYVGSRQFYCRQYERLAKESQSFTKLKRKLDDGYNLQICGYDGFDINSQDGNLKDIVKRHYLDSSKPFGHELVLFTLLVLDEKDYPWPAERTAGDYS
jgi:hypothetical protein